MADFQNESELVGALMEIPLFANLDYGEIEKLLECADLCDVETDAVLCEPNTIDERLIVFLEGKLRIETLEGHKLADVAQLRIIGEMGVFTGQPRSSRVVAEEASTILELEGSELQELVEGDPDLGNHLLMSLIKLLYDRTHYMNDDIKELREKLDRLRQRLTELAPDDSLLAELFPDD